MFASAGLSARVLRNNRSYTLPPPPKSGKSAYHHKRRKKKVPFQCYVPFLWSTCIGTITGLVVMAGGCAMCVTGYYADYYSSTPMGNATYSYSLRNEAAYKHLRSLTYIGPVLMGIGCFVVVVACVVVCETRDKVLRARAEEDPKRQKKRKILDAYDLIIDKVKVQESVGCINSPKQRTASPSKTIESKKPSSKKDSLSSPVTMGAIGKALVSIPMDIFSVELEKAKISKSTPNMPSPVSPKSTGSHEFNFGIIKQKEQVLNESISKKSRTLPLDRRKARFAVSRLVPSDKLTSLYDPSVASSPSVTPGNNGSDDQTLKEEVTELDTTLHQIKEERSSAKNESYSSEDEITITQEPILNRSASASIATEESFLSLGLKNRIMNRTDIPAISENSDHPAHPITVVVQASIHSDNGVSEEKSKSQGSDPLTRQDTKESGVGSATSSRTISPVGVTRTGHGSVSDDDSLHLTDEMLKNFDAKSPSPVV